MPDGFNMHVKKAGLALEVIRKMTVVEISLDHDLGGGPNGHWLASQIEELAEKKQVSKIKWACHSDKLSSKKRIVAAMESADRFWEQDS